MIFASHSKINPLHISLYYLLANISFIDLFSFFPYLNFCWKFMQPHIMMALYVVISVEKSDIRL